MKRAKSKGKSGYQKMTAAGKRAILLAVTPEMHATLTAAAHRDMRSLSGFVLHAAATAAAAAATPPPSPNGRHKPRKPRKPKGTDKQPQKAGKPGG